jgi:flagellar motor switch protein FliM
MSDSARLLRFAMEGERVRRAASALEQASPQLALSLRRAMPFLTRQGAQVALCFARAIPIAELLADLPRPIHATHLVSPGGARGALVLDAGAIAMVLDGVLGGDGRSPPKLDPSGLTPPQVALIACVNEGVVRSLSDVLSRKFGVGFQITLPNGEDASSETAPIVCSFELGAGEQVGRVMLLLAKEALLRGAEEGPEALAESGDPRVAGVLDQVELELIAELARMQMTLGQLACLRVGDVVRLDVPVGGAVHLRAEGRSVLRGHPTTSAGQIAIRIDRGHTG